MSAGKALHLGRYRLLDSLGRGSMGVVYKALDTALDRVVAVKTISAGESFDALGERDAIEIFVREAKIAGRLAHPNITAIYDIGHDQGAPFFVMEYVKGVTLEEIIKARHPLPLLERLRVLASAGRTLAFAHQRGVIHRDIKPGNIMIVEGREPKIMDFGVAKLDTGPLLDQMETGRILGTPHYMSPEQIRGEPVDHKTDIYSLGVTAFELLTGRRPFEGASLRELFAAILRDPPPPLPSVNPTLPAELDRVLTHALAKRREQRYPSASQFADALDLYLSRLEMAESPAFAILGDEKLRVVRALRKNYTFFSTFEDEEIVELFKLASREDHPDGEVIFSEGAPGNKMYVIIDGQVKIVQKGAGGGEHEISVLREGELFGEMAVIDNSPRSATARAIGRVRLVAINEVALRVTRPELCVKLFKSLASILAEKVRRTDRRIQEVMERSARLMEP
ncbi:MAG: protein kinase [Nitrospinae bacterium]|nr:protein kinase [Nitrospinota bacterium]